MIAIPCYCVLINSTILEEHTFLNLALVISSQAYYNTILAALHELLLIYKASSIMLLMSCTTSHVTTLLKLLHRIFDSLPVEARIKYKTLVLAFRP